MSREVHVRFCESREVRSLPATHRVVLVHGQRDHVEDLREQIANVLAPMGLNLSQEKTRIAHMSEGFDFLGFRIQWRRKQGSSKWYVYTFIADRPFRSVKDKIRALTPRTSQWDLSAALIRINQITHGWSNYFKHAIAQRTFEHLHRFTWWRIVRMMRTSHRWRWKDVRRWLTDLTGRWHSISADGIELFNPATIPIRRYRYRGQQHPQPLGRHCLNQPDDRNHGEPVAVKAARRVRRAAWGNGPRETATPRPRPTQPHREELADVQTRPTGPADLSPQTPVDRGQLSIVFAALAVSHIPRRGVSRAGISPEAL